MSMNKIKERSPIQEEIKELQNEENNGEKETEEQQATINIQNQIALMEVKHEPSKLDMAYEAATVAAQGINNVSNKKHLIFRPYIDPISIRPYKPQDKGYYFKFYNGINVPLIRYTFEDNGFREATDRN